MLYEMTSRKPQTIVKVQLLVARIKPLTMRSARVAEQALFKPNSIPLG